MHLDFIVRVDFLRVPVVDDSSQRGSRKKTFHANSLCCWLLFCRMCVIRLNIIEIARRSRLFPGMSLKVWMGIENISSNVIACRNDRFQFQLLPIICCDACCIVFRSFLSIKSFDFPILHFWRWLSKVSLITMSQ